MRIGITELFVDDQERARAFYTEVLGLEVKSDAPYGDGRWLTVVSPADPDGTEIKLSPLAGAAGALQRERRAAGVPALSFTTEDCERDCAELKARGVQFVSEASRRDYGGMDAVFEDGCGNLLNLHQE
jgi:catechol 2,3-dioxygenase-like lactoylglutathione lyase family enzyme